MKDVIIAYGNASQQDRDLVMKAVKESGANVLFDYHGYGYVVHFLFELVMVYFSTAWFTYPPHGTFSRNVLIRLFLSLHSPCCTPFSITSYSAFSSLSILFSPLLPLLSPPISSP
jgi:hypothetical protein